MIPALRARAALFELFDYFAVRVACGAGAAAMMAVLVVARRPSPSSESSESRPSVLFWTPVNHKKSKVQLYVA